MPFNELTDCRYGRMLVYRNDRFISRSLAVYGEWCQGEIDLALTWLRPGDTVVDAGANIGTHTVAFAQAVGPTGMVHAFEPQRLVFQTLCANVALNGLTNVTCWPEALGARPTMGNVVALNPALSDNFGSLDVAMHGGLESVPVSTLDMQGLQACRLLKVDVEGMEVAFLSGAQDTIRRCRPVIYIECDRQDQAPQLITHLQKLGYRLFWHLVPFFNAANFRHETENVFPALAALNLLGVPAEWPLPDMDLTEVRHPTDWPANADAGPR